MCWVCVFAPSFPVQKVLNIVVLIVIIFVRKLLSKVSYALWFSSIIGLMTWLVMLLVNIISI